MIEAFKNISNLLIRYQDDKNFNLPQDLKARLEQQQQDIDILQNNYKQKEATLTKTIQTLTSELSVSKDKIGILHKTIAEKETKIEQLQILQSSLLEGNKELSLLQNQYQEEIQKKIDLMAQLNQAMGSLKEKVNIFLQKSNKQTSHTMLYLPDTILAEIRQDVLKGEDFEFIKKFQPESNKEIIIDSIRTKISQKWIQQLQNILDDLKTIQANLSTNSVQTSTLRESLPMWSEYNNKLQEFMKMWDTKAKSMIWAWAKMRNPQLKNIV
jgi:hypothetical protein